MSFGIIMLYQKPEMPLNKAKSIFKKLKAYNAEIDEEGGIVEKGNRLGLSWAGCISDLQEIFCMCHYASASHL